METLAIVSIEGAIKGRRARRSMRLGRKGPATPFLRLSDGRLRHLRLFLPQLRRSRTLCQALARGNTTGSA